MQSFVSTYEPLQGFRPGLTQTGLYSHRRWLEEEGLYFLCSKNKGANQLSSYRQLICTFIFTYAKSRFPHDGAQMSRVMRKPTFCICENKDADQLAVTAKLISAFVFATWIEQPLFFQNPKFQASSHVQ